MIKRFFRRLFGLPTPDEKTAFDAAVDDLNKTIEQLDRDIHIIRSASEEGMKRQEKLDHDCKARGGVQEEATDRQP